MGGLAVHGHHAKVMVEDKGRAAAEDVGDKQGSSQRQKGRHRQRRASLPSCSRSRKLRSPRHALKQMRQKERGKISSWHWRRSTPNGSYKPRENWMTLMRRDAPRLRQWKID